MNDRIVLISLFERGIEGSIIATTIESLKLACWIPAESEIIGKYIFFDIDNTTNIYQAKQYTIRQVNNDEGAAALSATDTMKIGVRSCLTPTLR